MEINNFADLLMLLGQEVTIMYQKPSVINDSSMGEPDYYTQSYVKSRIYKIEGDPRTPHDEHSYLPMDIDEIDLSASLIYLEHIEDPIEYRQILGIKPSEGMLGAIYG